MKVIKQYINATIFVFVIMTVTRILFYLFNINFFSKFSFIPFLMGIRFDWVVISYFFIPLYLLLIVRILFKNKLVSKYAVLLSKVIFVISLIIITLFNCIDIQYFKFTERRSTADLFPYLTLSKDIFRLIPQFLIDYWYILLLWILLLFLSIYFSKVIFKEKKNTLNYKHRFISIILTIIFVILGARGGVQLKPLAIINAGEFVSIQDIPIVLNTPFTILKTLFVPSEKEFNFFKSKKESKKYFSPVKESKKIGKFNSKNIVIIILESFSKEYIGSLSYKKSYTPFLDSLIEKSFVFTNAYANGKRSIEAIPAILSSLPSIMNTPYIISSYSSNKIYSIASLLKDKGYFSAFFHGGNNGTMAFDAYASIAGFDKYYGKNEYPYPDDYDGVWGIYDEPFLQFFAKKNSTFKEPFISVIFTLSSHHPFKLPAKYKNTFKGSELPIFKTIQYTDHSLKLFFKTASKEKWYKNTLFVITSDHCSLSKDKFYTNAVGSFQIPVIFFSPSDTNFRGKSNIVIQQSDIMPTILSFLNFDKSYLAFGNDAFDKQSEHFAINYLNGMYQFIDNSFILRFDGEKTVAAYNYKEDKLLKHNLINSNKIPSFAKKENILKAFIQEYNYRLIHNKFTISAD